MINYFIHIDYLDYRYNPHNKYTMESVLSTFCPEKEKKKYLIVRK